MALGISSGMLANALGVGQDRIRQEQAQKANYANAISSVGQSIAGGIKDYKAEQNAIALEEARAERERAAREAFAKQAQDFQREMAERQRTQQVQDQELEFGRQARGNAAAFKAAGLNVPAGAAMMSPAMVGPLTSKLLGEQQDKAQASQFGSLMAPTPRMPIGNPLGFPGMPSEIPSMPATPGAVSMRAGTMKGGVDPSVFAKAMEGAQATYPKPKPQAETAWSPEAIERRKMLAEFQAGLSSKSDADRAAAARTLQQERLAAQQKMQEESIAARREIEELRVANDPRLKQMALQALTTRKSGLLPRLTKAMETANYGPDDEAKKAAADEAKTIRDTLAEIDAALKGMSSMQPVPAPQGAPSGGGSDPTPAELAEMDAAGMRWDAATRSVVPK